MTNKKDQKKTTPPIKPDPETLNTTDPQEEMEGPLSSAAQRVKEAIDQIGKKDNTTNDKKK